MTFWDLLGKLVVSIKNINFTHDQMPWIWTWRSQKTSEKNFLRSLETSEKIESLSRDIKTFYSFPSTAHLQVGCSVH